MPPAADSLGLELGEFVVGDGTTISYRRRAGSAGLPTIVLIHGWSGSGRSFEPCLPPLAAAGAPLLVPDLRFHGRSGKPPHGLHIARLAADMHELMLGLGVSGAVLVGTSMGCAVIWSLHEIFGLRRSGLACGCVFVDQAPLQNKADDWQLGSKGCYDEASLQGLQTTLGRGLAEVADGNEAGCLSKPVPPGVLAVLREETLLCNGRQLGKLMADHTQLDWRPTLATVDVPCLSLCGGDSGCFPLEGLQEVARLVPQCNEEVYEGCNHWLHIEEPNRFAESLLGFAQGLHV